MSDELLPRLSLVTPADGLAVTVDEAKASLRVLEAVEDEDDLIQALIVAAQARAETEIGRALLTQTWQARLDGWPCHTIEVPLPPLRSVAAITYVDPAGGTQTWAANQYRVATYVGPFASRGRITTAYGVSWPSLRVQSDAVTVEFDAGYGEASDVPAPIRQAMLLMVGQWFDVSRSGLVVGTIVAEIPLAAAALLRDYKVGPVRMAALA